MKSRQVNGFGDIKCRCGGESFYVTEKGSQKGMYCVDCDSWAKWLGKKDYIKFIGKSREDSKC